MQPKNVDKNTVIGTSTKATAETVEALKVAKAKGGHRIIRLRGF
ncbi:hypothetical protein [Clostridium fessum]